MDQTVNNINRYVDCHLGIAGQGKGEGQFCKHPFVTIAREVGAGGTSVAKLVAEKLNNGVNHEGCPWTVFDKSMVAAALEDQDLPKKFAEFMPEKKVSEIKDMIEELAGLHPAQWTLVKKTAEAILHLAQVGNCVLVGRGSNVITKKLPSGVHIRLIGSKKMRLLHTQDFYGLSAEKATKFMDTEDKGRRAFVKEYFGKDINDPTLYDLVINTDNVSYEETANIIVLAVKSKVMR